MGYQRKCPPGGSAIPANGIPVPTMTKSGEDITSESIKLKYLGKDVQRKTLIDVFREHNDQMKALLGSGFKPNTPKGYNSSLSHIGLYLQDSHGTKDMEARKIDHAFVIGYEFFLRSSKGCSEISAAKYMKHFRKIVKIRIAHRWVTEDPFAFYKNTAKARPKEYLTKDELDGIEQRTFSIARLEHVRDIFVFSCYTGTVIRRCKKADP